jgi:YgiT-type zinc finger domain-containing protein
MPLGKEGSFRHSLTQCSICGERCEERRITVALPNSVSGLNVIRNVPASVCLQCGETHFSIYTTGRLMRLLRSDTPPESVAMVPIYDIDQIH